MHSKLRIPQQFSVKEICRVPNVIYLHNLTFLNFNAFGFQEIAQFLYFLLKFPYEFSIGILVDDGFADNLFGAISISENVTLINYLNLYFIVFIHSNLPQCT